MRQTFTLLVLLACCLGACQSRLKQENEQLRQQIDDRREALVRHRDSALAEAQRELALTDSLLTDATARHDELHAWVMEHSSQLDAQSAEVAGLAQLRARRDSLQVRFDVLCAKIKYIHRQQKE